MRLNILTFILTATGSFMVWLSNGFKGKFNDYMTGPYEVNNRSFKRMFVGILTLGILLSAIFHIISKF